MRFGQPTLTSTYLSKALTARAFTSMLFRRSRCSFAVACTAYMIANSMMGMSIPAPMNEFGPSDMNIFGKPSTHTDRYDVGYGFHFSLRSMPLRPMILKGSCQDVS